MKKIINGKKYDTGTAKKLASYSNDYCGRDSFCTVLYLKRTGEYFKVVERGEFINDFDYACYIEPLTEEKAKEWVERYANDDYEKIFGECAE